MPSLKHYFIFALFFLIACSGETSISTPTAVYPSPTAVSQPQPVSAPTTTAIPENPQPSTEEPTETAGAPVVMPPVPAIQPVINTAVDGTQTEEIVLPFSYEAFLQNQIDNGYWTEAEGVTQLLRYFIGELNSMDLDNIPDRHSEGIFQLAHELIDNPETLPETRAELERLINTLIIPQLILDQISQPAPTESSKPTYQAKSTSAQILCDPAKLAKETLIDNADFFNATCFFFDERTIEGQTVKIYYPASWLSNQQKLAHVDTAFIAVEDSIRTYKPFGTFQNINMVFSLVSNERTLAHQASIFQDTEVCPVTIFGGAYQNQKAGNFGQTIAHELFHCFQDWNMPTNSYALHKWWLEGSAEYFSNVVYPSVNDEHGRLSEFDRQSVTKTILEMDYENFLFFQHLGNTIGDDQIIAMLKVLAMTPSPEAQADVMASVPNMDQIFHDFALAYLTIGIRDTGGGFIKGPKRPTAVINISNISSETLQTRPFLVTRYLIIYAPEKRYLQTGAKQEDSHFSATRVEGNTISNAWKPLPSEIRSECKNTVRYIHVLTSVREPATYKLEITEVEKASCDPCLLGHWELNNQTFADMLTPLIMQNATEIPAGMSLQMTMEGRYLFEFKEDGVINSWQQNFLIRMKVLGESVAAGVAPTVDTTINAHGTGKYSADGEKLTVRNFINTVESATSSIGSIQATFGANQSSVTMFGQTSNLDAPNFNEGAPPATTTSYLCTDETLTLNMQQGEVSFTRLETPPALPTPQP
ncbi:MAG: hypothetical protein AAF490_26035 [Chloroflexota bacterium]